MQVIEMNDFNTPQERSVDSYHAYYILNEITAWGTEINFFPKAPLKHYLIIEELNGHVFEHTVFKLRDEYFPISTKCKSIFFVIRKNYTKNIENFLIQAEEFEVLSNYLLPRLPIQSLADYVETIGMDDKDHKVPEKIFEVYDKCLLECPVLEQNNYYISQDQEKTWGYLDTENIADDYFNTVKLIDRIISRTGPKPGREGNEVGQISVLMNRIVKHTLPYEEHLCIFKDIEKVIQGSVIYYPCKDMYITRTDLTGGRSLSDIRDLQDVELGGIVKGNDFKLVNFNVKKFLRYCDLYLPLNCDIVYYGNTCKQFKCMDEYFYTYYRNNKYQRNILVVPQINLEEDIDKSLYPLLADLFGLLNHKTSLEKCIFKRVTKLNGNKVKLELSDRNKDNFTYEWDLTMLHLSDPIQYGLY